MAVVNKFNVNKQEVRLDADIIENMSANDVSYNDSFQYDKNTVGEKLSKLESEIGQFSHKVEGGAIVLGSNTNPPIWSEKMVNGQGELINVSSPQYKLTNPILLDKGDNIQVSQLYSALHCVLYETDSTLSYITPLTNSSNEVNYTALYTCYVVVAINIGEKATYSIVKNSNGLEQEVSELTNDVDVLSEKVETHGEKLSKVEHEVIYDVTVNNNGVVFESLSALLSDSNLSTLIPTSVRCGGMSIRFIQSSDNKYIQYRLTNQNWSIDVDDWQGNGSAEFSTGEKVSEVGIDDKPAAESDNLITSGSVYSIINGQETDVTSDFIWTYSQGIDGRTGNIVSALDRKYSSPISLNMGDVIRFTTQYTAAGYMAIAKVQTVDVLYQNVGTLESNGKSGSWTAIEDCQVAICVNKSGTTNIYVESHGINGEINNLNSKLGVLSSLTTNNKTSLVNAANEINVKVETLDPTTVNLVSGTDFTVTNGTGVGEIGNLLENPSYWKTNVVAVSIGDIIIYRGDYNNSMSVISRTDENETYYKPILISTMANNTYSVEIDFDGYVVFSSSIALKYTSFAKKTVSEVNYELKSSVIRNNQKRIADEVENYIEENKTKTIRYRQESAAAFRKALFDREIMLSEVHAMTDADVLVSGDCGYIINNDDPADVTHGTMKWKIYKNGILYIYGYGRMYDYLKGTNACQTVNEINTYMESFLEDYPYDWYYGFLSPNLNDITPTPAPYGYRYTENGEVMAYSNKRYEPQSHCDSVNTFIRDDCGFERYNKVYGYTAPWFIYRTECKHDYQPPSAYSKNNPTNIRYNRICFEEDTSENRGGITYIGDWAFYRASCDSLILPDHVESIGCWGVRYSPVMRTLIMGNLITEIEDHGVSRMEALEYCRVSSALQTLKYNGMEQTSLRMIELPSSLTNIPTLSFNGNIYLDYVKIVGTSDNPSQIASIGSQAFVGAPLSVLDIPVYSGIKTIGYNAFYNCNSPLITIPSSVTSIGYNAFYLNKLKKVVIDSETIASTIEKTCNLLDNADVLYIKNTISTLSSNINKNFIFYKISDGYNIYVRYEYSGKITII